MLTKTTIPLLVVIFGLLLSLNFFWTRPLVPGFDTPFYLTEIRNFSRSIPNPLTYPHLDRYLTIAFPGTITAFTGLDPVTSYRLAISIEYILMSIALYFLFRNLTGNKTGGSLLSSTLVVSPFLITYSTMLFANFTGFLALFTFFAIETSRDFRYKNLLLGTIFGSIFYIHNFSAISISLILGVYYLLKAIFSKSLSVVFSGLSVLVVALIVGFVGYSRYLNIDLYSLLYPTTSQAAGISVPSFPWQPVLLGNEWSRILDSFVQHSGKYWLLYFAISSLVLIYLSRRELLQHKHRFLLFFSVFIPSLLLSLQPLFGVNFLPERFITLVGLSLYFAYAGLISLPKFKKILIPLAVAPLFFTYLSADSLILDQGYRSFSNEEIGVYKHIHTIVKPDSLIFVPSGHHYWARYLLDRPDLIPGDHFISCGTVTEPGYFGDSNYTFAKLLSESDLDKAGILLAKLKDLHPGKIIYLITDTNLPCGHGQILEDVDSVRSLFNQGNWHLYEVI